MDRESEIHDGFIIAHDGKQSRVDLHKFSGGSSVMVYVQTELTRDLYEARDKMKGVVIHNTEDVQPHGLKSAAPYVTYRNGDEVVHIDCDYVIGAEDNHVAHIPGQPHLRPEIAANRVGIPVLLRDGPGRTGRKLHLAALLSYCASPFSCSGQSRM